MAKQKKVKYKDHKCLPLTLDLMFDQFGDQPIWALREVVFQWKPDAELPACPSKTHMFVILGEIYDDFYKDRDI